jgi:probable rRNA maturation factor
MEHFAGRAAAFAASLVRDRARAMSFPDDISVVLISDRRMSGLHRRFLNATGPTDVITFQHGEIFISAPTAQRQAKRFGTSTRHEIQLYISHGLLHLAGFDDQTPAQRAMMRAAEAKILRYAAV